MTLVAEIVTFRAKAGADPAAVAEAAAQTTEWVARQPGFVGAGDAADLDDHAWRSTISGGASSCVMPTL